MDASSDHIMLVTQQKDTIEAVSEALGAHERFAISRVCADLAELTLHIERQRVPFVLVDVDPEPGAMLAELDPLSTRFSETRFILLCERVSDDIMLEAMQVGARHVLGKKTIRPKLTGVLQRLLPNGALRADRRGEVITILPVSGGCGATTLALNLANEMSLEGDQQCMLLDLDGSHGGAAAYLGLRSPYGLADVLSRNGDLDPQLIRSTAQSYSDNFLVLSSLSAMDLNAPAALEASSLRRVLRACRQSYDYTFVDAPRVPVSLAAELIGLSSATLMVLQLTVKDVAVAKAMLEALREHRVAASQVLPVINRYNRRHAMITLEEAGRALGDMALEPICNDYRSALKCMNHGRLLAESSPRSALRRQLRDLSGRLVKSGAARTRS